MINHLWQSTVFAVAAGLLTLAFRKNRAQVRYWLWFSGSVKFFVPFLPADRPGRASAAGPDRGSGSVGGARASDRTISGDGVIHARRTAS